MGRPLTRKLLQSRTAKKSVLCRHCLTYIPKGTTYTYSTIIGFWGSYHDSCFRSLSVNLETKVTGEPKPNNSTLRSVHDTAKRILILRGLEDYFGQPELQPIPQSKLKAQQNAILRNMDNCSGEGR